MWTRIGVIAAAILVAVSMATLLIVERVAKEK